MIGQNYMTVQVECSSEEEKEEEVEFIENQESMLTYHNIQPEH